MNAEDNVEIKMLPLSFSKYLSEFTRMMLNVISHLIIYKSRSLGRVFILLLVHS